MHPILIKIGPITIYSYGFFIASAFLLGLAVASREVKRRGLNVALVSDLGFYVILSAILGSRLFYVLIKWKYFRHHLLETIMIWKGGLVFVGGAICALASAIIFLRKKGEDPWIWADCFAPAIAIGQFVGRIGCLMAGCCYGRYCTMPWAITFTDPHSLAPLNVPLHPTEIYHSLAGLITFFILWIMKDRFSSRGQLFGLLLLLYAIGRFTIEFYRGDFRPMLGPLSVTQWLAIGIFLCGIVIIFLRGRKAHDNR